MNIKLAFTPVSQNPVDLMAVVLHPKHQDFYADLLGFEKIEEKVVPD